MFYACYDLEVKLTLQLLQGHSFIRKTTGTDENAQLDIEANGLWGCYFFDVKIFKPMDK